MASVRHGGLLGRHPAQDDGHQEGGGLVVGQGSVGHPRHEPFQRGPVQLAPIPFRANEIDSTHGSAGEYNSPRRFPSPMADAPTLSPEVSRSVSALARTLVAASRSWALYPPDHPAVRSSLDRLLRRDRRDQRREGVRVRRDPRHAARGRRRRRQAGTRTPSRKPPDGSMTATSSSSPSQEGSAPPPSRRLLGMLSEDPRIIRQRGGPARVWADEGDAAITVEQIDFTQVLEDRDAANPVRRKDDVWRAIVRGILDRSKPTDEAAQSAPARDCRRRHRDRRAGERRHRARTTPWTARRC